MQKKFIIGILLLFILAGVSGYFFFWRGSNPAPIAKNLLSDPYATLPSLSYFKSHPSDQFLVDMAVVASGHPFKGKRSSMPHAGAHINFSDDWKTWPRGGSAPENYPPIYAVADGVVTDVTDKFNLGVNDRYGVSIALAKDGDAVWTLDYSIEPFVPEPSKDFYKKFIKVAEGEQVKKGQIIAYMYLQKGVGNGPHIHFHLRQSGKDGFYAPAIFTTKVVSAFRARWGTFGVDGGIAIPVCMGWKLAAEENPFGTGALDCLLH